MNPHNLDETATSGASAGNGREPTERTDANSQTEVTVIRTTPSAATVNDMADPNNFGKYELLGEIARGGMGVVYRARQHGLERMVALKMILATGISRESSERFLQEARAAAALDHPNVVPIYDIGEIGNKPYFTMALIDGPNLRGFVDTNGVPPIPTAVSLFAQIVAGVAHAHRHGIIHRDLKPANVLMDKDGRPRVTDFGLAKRTATDTQLTATGQVVGTPQYMAPEQARESRDVGPPADVYSLGAVLYFLLTGRAPFHGESFTDLLVKVVSEAPEPPRLARPDVPADLEVLCLRCLAKLPAERFADANELAAALAPIAERYHVSFASIPPALGRIRHPRIAPSADTVADASSPSALGAAPQTPPNRWPVIAGLSLLAVLLVGGIVYLATRDQKPAEQVKQDPSPGPKVDEMPRIAIAPPPRAVEPKPKPPGANDTNKFAWPAAERSDFKLKVELDAPGKKEADGTLQLIAGTPMILRLTAEKDCRVAVWVIDPAGVATRLFPNDDDPDNRLMAGKTRVIPGNDNYTLETTPTEGSGMERLIVLATTGEPPAFPPGTKNSRFTFYATDTEREKLASTIRGIVIKKAGANSSPSGEVSYVELPFRVRK